MSDWHWKRLENPWRATHDTKAVWALSEWRDHLYLGTRNLKDGGEILRSSDGEHWEDLIEPGFDNRHNHDIYGLVAFRGMLYAGTYNGIHRGLEPSLPVTGGQVWRSRDGRDWQCVVDDGFGDQHNQDIFNLAAFGDHIYVGTFNPDSGAEIWRSDDGTQWHRVFKAESNQQDYVRAFAIMADKLYASGGKLSPFALYETDDGLNWTDVVRGRMPERLTDGMRVAVVDDVLIASLAQWRTGPVEIWRYAQDSWDLISEPGFGFPENQLAGAMAVDHDRVVLATENEKTGTQVWLCDDPRNPSWRQINESGFGDSRNALCVFGTRWFRDRLYVGTATNASDWSAQLWVGTD